MKHVALLAATAGGAIVLAACSQTSPTSALQASPATITHSAAAVSCHQLYDAWQNGPAKKIVAALETVDSVSTVGDIRVQIATLKTAAPTIVTAARYPIPTCADPKGYWNALLMHVNAATSSMNSAAGATSITVALKQVPRLERELSTELKRAAGAK